MKIVVLLFFIGGCLLSSAHPHPNATEEPNGYAIPIQRYSKVNGTEQQIIEFDQDAIYNMFDHPEVKDRKVVVFSIIGAYRRGKSFFLGYCLRFLYARYKSVSTINSFVGPKADWMGSEDDPLIGFTWKPGRKACTNGILFWSDVFLHDGPNGEKTAIVLMDTQGLFEPGVSSDLNARIFGLSTLISSIQVINLSGVIQEDQLQYLEMSTEFTKLVQNRNSTNLNLKPFQDMIFLVRDWTDEDTGFGYEGGAIVWEEIQAASSNNVVAENVRKNIKKAFDKISTFLLPHPGAVVAKKGYNGSFKNLEKDFIKYLMKIIEATFEPENLVVKKVFGKEIEGSDFKNLIVGYFTAFNKNELPKVESIFAATAYREMEKICDTLEKEFASQMSGDVNLEEDNVLVKLMEKSKNLKNSTLKKFMNTPKMGDETMEAKMLADLDRRCQEIFEKIQKDVLVRYEDYQKHKEEIRKLNLTNEEQKRRMLEAQAEANRKLVEKSNELANQAKLAREAAERAVVAEAEKARLAKEHAQALLDSANRELEATKKNAEATLQYEKELQAQKDRVKDLEIKALEKKNKYKSDSYKIGNGLCTVFTFVLADCD